MRKADMKRLMVWAVLMAGMAASAANMQFQNARTTPTWFTQGVMYQVQPRAFTPEGTLKAAAAKLPYLKETGVTIVYLLPVFAMDADMDKSFWSPRQIRSGFNNPKNQYRIADYFHVDEEYGTDADLKDFCAAAHRLGLKVLFDLVYLHCGPTAPILKAHPEFTWWDAPGKVAHGPWRFPCLNFDKPSVREYLLSNVTYLMAEFGADGFRCDVGDGIPLDFWCTAHDRMDALSGGKAILLCEGSNPANQTKGFDADYGWFPDGGLFAGNREGGSARNIRNAWTGRERGMAVGARFVNHYENHDIATDERPRRELKWGHDAVDQVIVWMFTLDGVPLLFDGNEFAESNPDHSMFGKTPLEWETLRSPVGQARHALVKKLAELRRTIPAFTAKNGAAGLTWLDVTQEKDVTAFVRRAGDETVLVVQNWRNREVETEVSFAVPPQKVPSYIALDNPPDRSVKGVVADAPLIAKRAERTGARSFRLGPYGFTVVRVEPDPWEMPPRNKWTGPQGRYVPTYPSVHNAATSAARPVPDFLKGAVLYQLFPRMFTPEGTFKAAERKLPELKDLGIDVIYLTPHQLADDDPDPKHWSARQRQCGFGNPKNPYRQKDYYAVDPEYGTAEDLKGFVRTAHRLGMKVLFDLVYFHCGPKAVFLQEHPDFIVRNADGTPRLGGWAFPELNIRNPELRECLYANMTGFIRDYDADGFRCDVADMVPVAFWEEGYRRCKALKPDVIMMCEGLKGDDQIAAFDLSYGFYSQWAMRDILAGKCPASELEKSWTAARKDFPKGFHWMRCFENHDFANVNPGEKRKEELYGHELNASLIATLFLLDGVPMLYNGQEIADASPQSIFSNRDHGGWHLDWTKASEPSSRERRALVKRLTALRHAHPGLFDAPLVWLETGAPDKAYAFRRVLSEGDLTLAVNVTNEPLAIVLDGKSVSLPARGFLLK